MQGGARILISRLSEGMLQSQLPLGPCSGFWELSYIAGQEEPWGLSQSIGWRSLPSGMPHETLEGVDTSGSPEAHKR